MENNTFYDVNDIMAICGCKQSKAYSVIRELNSELASKGFLTFQGKVSRPVSYTHLTLPTTPYV